MKMLPDNEAIILNILKGVKNIPIFNFNEYDDNKDIIVETKCGPSVHDILKYSKDLIDIQAISLIGTQIFLILKQIHNKGVNHNDIKSSNICWGKFENQKLVETNSFF